MKAVKSSKRNSASPALGNVFITGATGLLGSELVAQILNENEATRVVCLVRDTVPVSRFYTEGLVDRVITVRGDVRDQNLLDRVMNEYDIRTVFHLAAQTLVGQANARPVETLDVNVAGTWALLEAARLNREKVKAVVVASSDKAYGNLAGESYDEDFALRGEHPYDVSKSCADLISLAFAKSYAMNVAVTRCGNFFGPGDLNQSRIFPSVIRAALRGEAPEIRSNGKPIRDYIFVADGAAAYRLLAHRMLESDKLGGQAFNFSYGLRFSVIDVVERILKAMAVKVKPKVLNQAKNEIPVQCLDSAKAKKLLGWKPAYGFDEGLKQTIEWYRAEGKA